LLGHIITKKSYEISKIALDKTARRAVYLDHEKEIKYAAI